MADLPKSRRQNQAKTDILNVALRMWRDPEADRFTLMHIGDYAADMRLMIDIASADAEELAEAVRLTGASEHDLVAAAVNYIEHCCQQMPVNPNRLLGLAPDATQETAKLHYRMLMKLFHPDRALIPQVRAEVCATAINQAYAQFREDMAASVAATSSASESIMQSGEMAFSEKPSGMAMPAPDYFYSPPPHQPRQSSGTLFRKIPLQIYFWGFAVIALIGLLVLNLNSGPMELTASTDTISVQSSDNMRIASDKTASVGADINSGFEVPAPVSANSDGQTGQLQVQTLQSQAQPQPLPAQSQQIQLPPPVSNQVTPVSSAEAAQTKSIKPLPVQVKPALTASSSPMVQSSPTVSTSSTLTGAEIQTALSVKDKSSPPLPFTPEATVAAMAEPVSQTETARIDEVTPRSSSELSELQLRELTLQFVDSYNQGDANRFAGLMHTQLKGTEGSSQSDVRESYSKLFAKSEQREIVLKDLRWEIHGNTAVGVMDYKTTLKLRSSRDPVISSGALKLEVRMMDHSPKISAFFNMPNKR